MTENKPVLVIDNENYKMLEVKEKEMLETSVFAVKEVYAVVKLDVSKNVSPDEILAIFLDHGIQYKIVEVVSDEE